MRATIDLAAKCLQATKPSGVVKNTLTCFYSIQPSISRKVFLSEGLYFKRMSAVL